MAWLVADPALVLAASSPSAPGAGVRLATLVAAGVASAAATGLVVLWARRRRARPPRASAAGHHPAPAAPVVVRRASSPTPTAPRGPVAATAMALAVSAQGGRICPTCRREFEDEVRYCPHDARRLVSPRELVTGAVGTGGMCPRCRRAFEGNVSYCPHDAEELVPRPLWEAMRGLPKDPPPSGVIAKICPLCASRYDLATTFCGADGTELMTIN